MLRVLSLGAGVQSSTLLLMACAGEMTLDAAIFADTQWEPAAVYQHLAYLEAQAAAAGIPVYRVTAGNLREDALDARKPGAWLPLFVRNRDGGLGMLRRQCTESYKIVPIRRQIRALLGAPGERPPAGAVSQAIGISTDEAHRMKPSGVAYITNCWPLIERGMSRNACRDWLTRRGHPIPPKSSCLGCPYHDAGYWRELKRDRPDEFAATVAFDDAIRQDRVRCDGEVYVHRARIPLAAVDLRGPRERGQLDLFGDECWGVCGV